MAYLKPHFTLILSGRINPITGGGSKVRVCWEVDGAEKALHPGFFLVAFWP